MAFETAERAFFAASLGNDNQKGGVVYEMKLFRHRKSEQNRGIEAIGGGGVSEAVRVEPDTKQSFHVRYVHLFLIFPRY